ncbi:MAG TPA: TonB-dependent receptor [Thermoanaerobaculia bacterium]|nr:TonB-dependent receptor [Thermoanaerobaculia bacterium]
MFRKHFQAAALAALFAVLSSSASGQSNAGTIRGVIRGPDGKPMASVPVLLRNDITGFRADATTGPDGAFQFSNVPFNPYEIHVEIEGFRPVHQPVDVRTSVPRDVALTLELPGVSASVEVAGEPTAAQLETDSTTSHIDIDKSYIARAPAVVASRAMEEIVTSTPGFAKDENGRFHFQGAHSQSEYVIDGQTISDQTGVTFSNSIDPSIAQSLEVIYGNVPAEYGEKIGAVINMVTKSGLNGGNPHGNVAGGYARFDTYDAGASVGGGTNRFGYFASFAASGSDYFTDPVNFDNLNNHGETQRGFIRLDGQTPDASSSFRLSALLGRTDRDVANTFTEAAAGSDRTVKTHDQNYSAGWQSIMDSATVLDVTAYGRIAKFTLYPSAADAPVIADSDRSLDNYGITPTLTRIMGQHELKVGAVYKRYPVNEFFRFGITDPSFNDPSSPDYNPNLAPYDLTRGGTFFEFSGSKTGTYVAGFAQDTFRWKGLTATVGLRYDSNSLPVADRQLEPRVGAAYYFEPTGTILRAAYNRVLYTPEYENILLSSSPEAASIAPPIVQESRALGGGQLLVHSERQDYWMVGAQQALGSKLRLDADYWERHTKFAGDQDQFFNTGVVFPLAFESGDYRGWDVRLDLAPTWGFRGFLSFGHTHAVYVPPPAGGLFLDPGAINDITGGPFLIDHDQKLQLQSGISYDIGTTGIWLGVNVRYDSGLVSGAAPEDLVGDPDNEFAIPYIDANHAGTDLDPYRIKARTLADFSIGADLTRYHVPINVQLMVLNATDVKGLYNILSTFGGTHVIPPRRVAGRITFVF